MISQEYNAVDCVNELLRKIRIKEKQLKIAQESNMIYVAEAIENQLLELRQQLSASPEEEPELYALMSLLDD
ncbi:hypothetical protein Nos7524_0241 [Nostoc sp. PCC 7524]|uniref:hypothetical protein n=1 Tax=Nostoc sp. (strain ATCC 29411 / PCC 7524) TaxID=28072 RepID=UPI00029F005E|nr:hypothetical protein [Nostoc sp. PCC 7524]AFY46163.1 hypothetical protein Nos7524_0241 [Nostoc sp. PCC 7524]